MGQFLPAFPSLPEHSMSVTLSGQQFVFRFVFRPRCRAWYFDLSLADGTPLVLGRKLRPGWAPLMGLQIPNLPTGLLYVRGPDAYAQADLGNALRVAYYERDELSVDDSPAPTRIVLA